MKCIRMKFGSTSIISLLYLLVCCGPAQTDVSLRVSPERAQFFVRESISLSCEEERNSMPGWSVKRQTTEKGNGTCANGWGNINGGTCIVALYRWDGGVYWCESKSGESSKSINIMIPDGKVILESPVRPVTERSDVTLRCLSKNKTTGKLSSGLPSDFYKDGSLIRTESTGGMTIQDVYTSDEGFYKCVISGLGESPESRMDMRELHLADVSLRVSPERSQFFLGESILLSCEEEGNSVPGWSVKRTSERDSGTCNNKWGTIKGVSCTITLYRLDGGVYWCQSESRELSWSIKMLISGGDVILESPVLPVMEGSDVTLHCLSKDKTTGNPTSGLPADFNKDGSLIRTGSTGQMTIHNVSKSDEGFYKCIISGLGESPESRMVVRDSPASKDNNHSSISLPPNLSPPPSISLPPSLTLPTPSSLPPYFYPLMGAGVSIFLLILGLCFWKKYRDPCCVRPVQSQGTKQSSADYQNTNQSGAPDDVYLPLQHGNTSVYGVIQHPDDYENDPFYVTPVESQGNNQGSATEQNTNQSGAPDDVYLPLQHGNTSVYGIIQHPDDYEHDPFYVTPVEFQGTNQGSAADQRTNQSAAPDDVYLPLQHGNTSFYGVIKHSDDYANDLLSLSEPRNQE